MKTFVKVLAIIMGILMIAGGFCCLFAPADAYMMVGYCVGLSMIFNAIGLFAMWCQENDAGIPDAWTLVGAIASIVLGFFVINSEALQVGIDVFLAYYIAVWLVVYGIVAIVRSFQINKLHKEYQTVQLGTHWWILLIIGIIMVAFGILCLFKPVVTVTTMGIFIGIGVIFSGALLITVATMPVPKYGDR